ncbi:MAG: hypothetical protein HY084_09990 [Gemmatimonadetes bacterium]|nr:hypothetical protein [Gemmatimonadota bacterium]
MRRIALLLVVVFRGAARATAQDVTPTAADCAAAAAVSGQRLYTPNDTAGIWWNVLTGCGDVGERAAADALRSPLVRRETDPDRLREFFVLFGGRRSAVLMAAYRELLEDGSSSAPMKLEAIRQLGWMKLGRIRWDSGGIGVLASSETCGSVREMLPMDGDESGLPTNLVAQLLDVMHEQEDQRANDLQVRVQAHCWRVALERALPPDPHKIKLTHVCGSRFSVSNENRVSVMTSYDVEGAAERVSLSVPSNGSSSFVVFADGNVRLFFGSTIIDHAKTSKGDCRKKEP